MTCIRIVSAAIGQPSPPVDEDEPAEPPAAMEAAALLMDQATRGGVRAAMNIFTSALLYSLAPAGGPGSSCARAWGGGARARTAC